MRLTTVAALLLASMSFSSYAADEMVEFHIKPGTGSQPFNTPDDPVRVVVGQTLRVINDDATPHLIHTFGSPCPHGDKTMRTGDYWDCQIGSVHRASDEDIYDHNLGPDTQFYIEATEN